MIIKSVNKKEFRLVAGTPFVVELFYANIQSIFLKTNCFE